MPSFVMTNFTVQEFIEDRDGKRILFIIVSAMALIVGFAFFIYDPENGKFVLLVMVGLIVIIGIVAFLSVKYDHYHNRKYLGESYITRDGVYLNRRLHMWKGLGSQLESVSYRDKESGPAILQFEYSTFGWQMRNYYIARVPVPNGQQEKAKQIAAEIASVHLPEQIG